MDSDNDLRLSGLPGENFIDSWGGNSDVSRMGVFEGDIVEEGGNGLE